MSLGLEQKKQWSKLLYFHKTTRVLVMIYKYIQVFINTSNLYKNLRNINQTNK